MRWNDIRHKFPLVLSLIFPSYRKDKKYFSLPQSLKNSMLLLRPYSIVCKGVKLACSLENFDFHCPLSNFLFSNVSEVMSKTCWRLCKSKLLFTRYAENVSVLYFDAWMGLDPQVLWHTLLIYLPTGHNVIKIDSWKEKDRTPVQGGGPFIHSQITII